VRRGFAQTGTLSVLLCPRRAASKCPILQGSALLRAPLHKDSIQRGARSYGDSSTKSPPVRAQEIRSNRHVERAVVSTASRLEVPDFAGICPTASPASQRFNSTRGAEPRRSFRQSCPRFVRKGLEGCAAATERRDVRPGAEGPERGSAEPRKARFFAVLRKKCAQMRRKARILLLQMAVLSQKRC
jgi:hypothetical protein